MTIDDAAQRPDRWGLHPLWVDARDEPHWVDPEQLNALREVIGTPPADLERTAPIVTRPGRRLPEAGEVTCENGTTVRVRRTLPLDFPLGYHLLRTADGRERSLIVSPGRCWLPEGWRAWGWTVQLYAARSNDSWGIGDLADLRALREWSEEVGAGFLLINPLHAVAPTVPQEESPYLPTTRRFRNPIYLCVREVSGAGAVDLTGAEAEGRALNALPLIDRDAIWVLKRAVLRSVFSGHADFAPEAHAEFAAWRSAQGSALRSFCIWMAVAAEHGGDWREWPDELRDPDGSAVADYAVDHADDVEFEAWLQWQLEAQLTRASGALKVLQDLPIGVGGGGADAWAWQNVLARGVTVGAPPDLYNTAGQDWGSPPPVPWRLRADGYRPFIESMRATMANAGGLRIDHVMGLFRIWWVPSDGEPAHGAYARYPSDDLLDIVALESHRHEALVVGEDLGTVEDGVRETLADRAMLSYRLLWFEEDDPEAWPKSAMAAITTHDLPTVAGLWSGADLTDQERHLDVARAALEGQRDDLLAPLLRHVRADLDADDAVVEAHRLLAEAPSILISATLDDAMAARIRPNMPGTPKRDNWCLPLPLRIEDLRDHSVATALVEVLTQATSSPTDGSNG